ncbi:hypothetical protein D9758_010744 [Tetrapyrgos nigripes]|uniref:Uncharacterized protein n=1 Tax=Tetrapyrgos nigripes TaxID=182062 RepID=A0A8H5FYI7_9AGAR|nr:hypothetical protein D9758_010744 [Tetrapyrgos nigripes]
MYSLRRAATGFVKDYLASSTTSPSPSAKHESAPLSTPPSAPAPAIALTPASSPATVSTNANSKSNSTANPIPSSSPETHTDHTPIIKEDIKEHTGKGIAVGETTTDNKDNTTSITNKDVLDSPLPLSESDSESESEHSFAFAEDIDVDVQDVDRVGNRHHRDPRVLHASTQYHVAPVSLSMPTSRSSKEKTETGSGFGKTGLRVQTSRPSVPDGYNGLTESESGSDTDGFDDVDEIPDQPRGEKATTHVPSVVQLHYPPLLATSFPFRGQPQRSLRHAHQSKVRDEDISEWSVVQNSHSSSALKKVVQEEKEKVLADLQRLQEGYELKLREKDEAFSKEKATWEWIKKDLIEKQKDELEGLKTGLEQEIARVKDDLEKTRVLLDAGNEQLEMARRILRQNHNGSGEGKEEANLAALDAGINRLKDGYEDRLREKERLIEEQRVAHEKQRLELTEALREVEKKIQAKEEEWKKEKEQMVVANEQRVRAYGYAAQSNATLIDKLREDAGKMEALLDSRMKELDKTQSQLKKIQQKWNVGLQDNRGRREVSGDSDKLPSPVTVKVETKKLFQSSGAQSCVGKGDTSTESPGIKMDVKKLIQFAKPNSLHLPNNLKPAIPIVANSSIEDVKRLLETLNSDIFQFAAQFTDDIDQLRFKGQDKPGAMESKRVEARKEVSAFLGSALVEYLSAEPAREDFDTIAQCALQSMLLQWFARVINMWAWNKEVNRELKEMYDGIQAAGSSDATRRWRMMTRLQTRRKWDGEWSTIMERIAASVMKFLFVVTGGREMRQEDEENKRQLTHQKLSSILGIAFQLNTDTGEGISSADYEVFCPRPGEVFDTRIMADDNELPVVGKFHTDNEMERKKINQQKIVCTCQLGLRRVIREQQAVVCKARVLLPSALTDWDDAGLKVAEDVTQGV